jgi:hypothetical protein
MKRVHAGIIRAPGTIVACSVRDTKFRNLTHNIICGTAVAAKVNAELLFKRGTIG